MQNTLGRLLLSAGLAAGISTLAGMSSHADTTQHASLVAMFNKARQAASVCSPIFMSLKPRIACLYQVEWHGEDEVPRAWSMGVHFQAFMDMSDIGDNYLSEAMDIDHYVTMAFHGHLHEFCNFFELDCTVFTDRFMKLKEHWSHSNVVKSIP
jgi:hypothetical protein